MKYKNYYKILELKGPSVSEDEIKSSYRKLAKKYHPDINKDNLEAQEKFKDVNEAYQILGEQRLRKRYNIRYYFHVFDNGIHIDKESLINSDFAKIFIGEEEYKEPAKIFDNTTSKSNLDEQIKLSLTLEECFEGTTKKITYKPYGEPTKNITIRVPRGSNDETQIFLRGEGRKANFGSENGNLLINVELKPHPEFQLDKIDIIKQLEITPAEATLGCNKSIKSVDEMEYKLVIPAGTQPGEILKIKEAGYISKDGKRGDLKIVVNVGVPKDLTQEEIELYEKLKSLNS